MSRLDAAEQRLERAVARLERAAEGCRARTAERAELATALEAARAESKSLREVGVVVSGRLDSVIGRLKLALEA